VYAAVAFQRSAPFPLLWIPLCIISLNSLQTNNLMPVKLTSRAPVF